MRVFRTKIFRLKKKIKDLKKNKNAEGLSDLLSQEFEFPVPNIELPVFDDNNKTQKLNYLVNKTKDVVFENRQLKRELVNEQDQLNNTCISLWKKNWFVIESVRFLYIETSRNIIKN